MSSDANHDDKQDNPGVIIKLDKTLNFFVTLSTLAGFLILTFYLLLNSAFPGNLNLGDGVLFLAIGLVFGAIYTIFAILVGALGHCYLTILKKLIATAKIVRGKIAFKKKLRKTKLYWAFALKRIKFDSLFITLLFALLGAVILVFMTIAILRVVPINSSGEPINFYENVVEPVLALWIMVPILLGLAFSIVTRNTVLASEFNRKRKLNLESERGARELRRDMTIFVALTLFFPLFISSALGSTLITVTMQAVSIRVDKADIYVSSPYSDILHTQGLESFPYEQASARIFERVTIVRRGLGNDIVIKSNSGSDEQYSIPNSHIVFWKKSAEN